MFGFGSGAQRMAPINLIDTLLLDLDGVIYAGESAIADAVSSVHRAAELVTVGYLTNNASRSAEQVAQQLRALGLDTTADQIVSSVHAAIHILSDRLAAGARVLVIGGDGLRNAVGDAGFHIVASADDAPVAVVQGFSPTLAWTDLAEAAFALARQDVLWVATNMDWTIPQARGVAPGNGTLVSAVHTAAGRMPDAVAGKPEPALYELACTRFGSERPLMVGDRLDTDIAGAIRAGMPAALVLTGISRPKQLLAADVSQRPRFVLRTLADVFEPYPDAVQGRNGWAVGDAIVSVDGLLVRVVAEGTSAINLLRAGCAAIWNAPHSIHALQVPGIIFEDHFLGEAH